MTGEEIDIGHGVFIRYVAHGEWEKSGLIEYHPCQGGNCNGGLCGGGVLFDLPGIAEAFPGRDTWSVEKWEPLTLWPSLQCGCKGCGHHGWIKEGRWVPA